jgi:GTPase SAR1 family protein
MKNNKKQKELLDKSNILLSISKQLKVEYVGIDKQIDQLVSYVEPWYVFNNIQSKPIIVNLWGMTSVGKTSLIQRLFKLLDLSNDLYRFDVRTLLEDDKISNKMVTIAESKKRNVAVIFDEFQNARTIDKFGVELTRSGLRGLWDLFDDGKIEMSLSSYTARKLYSYIYKLKNLIRKGLTVENGLVTNKRKLLAKSFNRMYLNTGGDNKFSSYFEDIIYDITEELDTYDVTILENINTENLVSHFENILDRITKPKIYDFSKSIFFIIGNLDEVYTNHNNFNPDMDADLLAKISSKINISDVKSALNSRFRTEQIARLGTNHLIYPTLGVKSFFKIIRMELDVIKDDIKKEYGFNINFSDNIINILYKESVYPTQGARPVNSRINSIIRPVIAKIIKEIFVGNINKKNIEWDYLNDMHSLTIGSKNFNFEFELQIENLRTSDKCDEQQYKTAVHEAGHAVCAIVNLNILPKNIFSKTADSNSNGFMSLTLPDERTKSLYNNYIVTLLGGNIAEELVFGTENIGDGAGSDLEKATNVSLSMVKRLGMYSHKFTSVSHNSPDHNFSLIKETETEIIAKKIIEDNQKRCIETLTEYNNLLFAISKYLTEHSFINKKDIKKLIKKTNPELLDRIKNKKKYHDFKGKFDNFFNK